VIFQVELIGIRLSGFSDLKILLLIFFCNCLIKILVVISIIYMKAFLLFQLIKNLCIFDFKTFLSLQIFKI